MALPTLAPRLSARKNIYEQALISRRNKENDFRNNWNRASNYFESNEAKAARYNSWTSDEYYQRSIDNYKSKIEKETKAQMLLARQKKLSKLFEEERQNYQLELSKLNKRGQNFEDMQNRADALKSARDDKRKQEASERLYDHWRLNNPEIRKLESDQHKEFVKNCWRDQIKENEEKLVSARREKEEYNRHLEHERSRAVEQRMKAENEKLRSEREFKEALNKQIEELHNRESESKQLKKEEDALIAHKLEVDKLEELQKLKEEEIQKQHFGRLLLRQHVAQLKRKSHLVQQELEQDMETLRLLSCKESDEAELLQTRREQARVDAQWMRQVLQEQLRHEKEREADMEMIYQHEAARMWEKREQEWSREREARQRLMKEVFDARKEQIDQRLDDIKLEKQESLRQRHELLQQIELANQMTQREKEQMIEDQKARRRELEDQIDTNREQRANEELRLQLDLDEEELERLNEEDLLRQETERMRLTGYTPRDIGRRKQAWM